MRLTVILRTLGVLFLLFSTTLLPPIGISFFYEDGEAGRFSIAFAIALFAVGSGLSLARIWRDKNSLRVAAKACCYFGVLAGLGSLAVAVAWIRWR